MQSGEFKNKRVLILGLGVSGKAVASLLLLGGSVVRAVDRCADTLKVHPDIRALIERGLTIGVDTPDADISGFDLVVVSPGIASDHPLLLSAKARSIPIIGEIELGCRLSRNPALGITGTNGKTTVTLLVAHALRSSGRLASALGNSGIPLTKQVEGAVSEEIFVLELSSYQLETLEQRALDAALILNITPDHLDRYKSMEEYAAAKMKIFRSLKKDAFLYVEEKTWEKYGYSVPEASPRLYGYDPDSFIFTDLSHVFRSGKKEFELPLSMKGKKSHDLENLLGAYALCADRGIDGNDFLDAWKIFRKPAHRLEYVAEFAGVKYYDDSKGTNADAVIRAVESLDGPITLIAGGLDKGTSFESWSSAFKEKVKCIYAIGKAAGKIREQLASSIPVILFETMDAAVEEAAMCSDEGDTVLLSPGCASFDMFRDYAHRGEEFQRMVFGLKTAYEQITDKK